jgi:hypothetical protein
MQPSVYQLPGIGCRQTVRMADDRSGSRRQHETFTDVETRNPHGFTVSRRRFSGPAHRHRKQCAGAGRGGGAVFTAEWLRQESDGAAVRRRHQFPLSGQQEISVTADAIVCRTSNVDISARSCNLTFKNAKRALKGREANEIYATAATAGVPSEGAAGSNIQSFSKLNCTIDPHEIMEKAGGGATCSLETAQ